MLPVFVHGLAERVVYKLQITVTNKITATNQALRLHAADAGTHWYRGKDEVSVVFAVSPHENQDEKGQLYYNVTLAEVEDDVTDEARAGAQGSDADVAMEMYVVLFDTYPGLLGEEGLLAFQRCELPALHSMPLCDFEG